MAGESPTVVTVLYTANLRGTLGLLPRLFTLIQQERRTASGPVLLLDLGDTCAADVWVCRATQGRAPLLALDGMGYDAAVIGGPEEVPIPPDALRQLVGRLGLRILIWNRAISLTRRGITLGIAAGEALLPAPSPGVRVDRAAPTLPALHTVPAVLGDVPQGHLARVDLRWPEAEVTAAALRAITAGTPPDPTVSALVELVEGEAAQFRD